MDDSPAPAEISPSDALRFVEAFALDRILRARRINRSLRWRVAANFLAGFAGCLPFLVSLTDAGPSLRRELPYIVGAWLATSAVLVRIRSWEELWLLRSNGEAIAALRAALLSAIALRQARPFTASAEEAEAVDQQARLAALGILGRDPED